jgi:acetyl esterase
MPLDPQIAPIVDAVERAAQEGPPASELTVDDRRKGYAALAAFAGQGPALDEVIDRTIPGPDGEIPVRIYRNAGARGIFVFYHGGGYTIGDLDTHDEVCRQLALQSGATLMAVDYRLAPEHPFPAGIEDAWAALNWADANRAELGGDPTAKVVVGGDSAGGNFSAVMALMARDHDVDLAAQLLVYPGVDMADDSPSMTENAEGYVLTAETIDWFLQCYAPNNADWRASPLLAPSHAGVAPALVITAEFDPLRDQGARYAEALDAAGVPVTLSHYEGMVHIFFQLGPLVEAGARAVTEVAQAARTALAQDLSG